MKKFRTAVDLTLLEFKNSSSMMISGDNIMTNFNVDNVSDLKSIIKKEKRIFKTENEQKKSEMKIKTEGIGPHDLPVCSPLSYVHKQMPVGSRTFSAG